MNIKNSLKKIGNELSQQTDNEIFNNQLLSESILKHIPIFGHHWNLHALSHIKRQTISRVLYYNELYKQVVDVPGVICEFGVQWGSTMAQLINLRGIYEPYNLSRSIIGFDTFSGFSSLSEDDACFSSVGDYSTGTEYYDALSQILSIHEANSPLAHIKKFELVKGDVCETLDPWLEENPHAIIAMAIFDMDIHKPTRHALEKIKPRLTKGSILVFDELSCPHFPGESSALQDVFGFNNLELKRSNLQTYCAWAVYNG